MNVDSNLISKLEQDCYNIRRSLLDIAFHSGGGQHLGGGLSIVELMVCLYGSALNITPSTSASELRDRFILSKGHGVLGFYPVLHHYGFISDTVYRSYKTTGSQLISHPIRNYSHGIESSNGSLGHGLSYSCGLSYGFLRSSSPNQVYVLLGDGECNEGSVWEAAMSASQLKLTNLTCIVDHNRMQSDGSSSDIIDTVSLESKWCAFGWDVYSIDGHCMPEILSSIYTKANKPKLILANTIKGKGVSFMENDNTWHHGRLTEDLYYKALAALA